MPDKPLHFYSLLSPTLLLVLGVPETPLPDSRLVRPPVPRLIEQVVPAEADDGIGQIHAPLDLGGGRDVLAEVDQLHVGAAIGAGHPPLERLDSPCWLRRCN